MTVVLVRLKLALLAAGLRRGGSAAQISIGVAFGMAATAGVVVGGGLVLARGATVGTRDDVTVVVATTLFLGWVLLPLLAAASDGTLEVDRLASFPLRLHQLMPGLLAASLVGTGGLFSVLVLIGLAGGVAPSVGAGAVIVLALAALLALCSATSRLVTALLSGAAHRRRWRDLAVFAAPLLVVALNVGFQLASRASRTGADAPGWVRGAGRAAGYLPSGLPLRSVSAAIDGRTAAAALWLVGSLAAVAVVTAGWGAVTARALTSSGSSAPTSGRSAATTAGGTPLFRGLCRLLPRTRVGVVAAKELRLQWRDPRQRVVLVSPLFAGAPLMASGAFFDTALSSRHGLVAAVPAFLLAASSTNLFGFDGPAHWVNVAAGDDVRADLGGKLLAKGLTAMVAAVVVAAGVAGWTGSPTALVAGVGLAACAIGVALGMAVPWSVNTPVPVPDTAANVFSSGNAGGGTAQVGPSLAVMFGGGAVVAPFAVVSFAILDRPVLLAVVVLVELAVGAVALHVGLNSAVRASAGRQPELLAALSARR